jgi:hypothetical protein
MRTGWFLAFFLLEAYAPAQEPFLTTPQWKILRDETSGVAPYENLRYLTGLHRVPGTAAFEQAAHFILERAHEYGFDDAHSEEFPIDGVRTYGLMRSYLAWNVEVGRLWELRPNHLLIGDAATDPIRLADYSHSASVETSLIDVGKGTDAGDYAGKDVRGKIVLADGLLTRVQQLAIAERGAAGILSDMPNQATAWSGLDSTLIRWGHLDARQTTGFAFMISRQAATLFRLRLAKEEIVLQAEVKATVGPGHWTVDTATIAGTDPAAGQIVFSCHLDHERPGANDDGSGCVTILEVARTLNSLIRSGALPRPRRTIRFLWGPEHEGTMAFLATHPEIMNDLRADIHMDMVGGDPFKDKAMFHVTETPWSLPSFVTDVGALFMETIRAGASEYAQGSASAVDALIEERTGENGARNEFLADVTPFDIGSDHDDYDSSTISVPSLYLRDWPDVYIHTDHDSLDQLDATKLRRVAALGAAAGYVYAEMGAGQFPTLLPFFTAQSEARLAKAFVKAQKWVNDQNLKPDVAWYEAQNLLTQSLRRESASLHSLVVFCGGRADEESESVKALTAQTETFDTWIQKQAKIRGATTPVRPWNVNTDAAQAPVRTSPFGPVDNQNDDALLARLGRDRFNRIKLIHGDTPQAGLYAYEILNFVDGKRTVGEIRDMVSAEFGPIAIDLVADYLRSLAEAKIIELNSPTAAPHPGR